MSDTSNRLRGLNQTDELTLAVAAARATGIKITAPEYLCDVKSARRIVCASRLGPDGSHVAKITVRETQHQPGHITVEWQTGGVIVLPGESLPKGAKPPTKTSVDVAITPELDARIVRVVRSGQVIARESFAPSATFYPLPIVATA